MLSRRSCGVFFTLQLLSLGFTNSITAADIKPFPSIDVEARAIADGANYDELKKRVESGKFTLDEISSLCAFRSRSVETLPLLIKQLTVQETPIWSLNTKAPLDYAIFLIEYLDPPSEDLIAALKPELAKSSDIRLRQAIEILGPQGLPLLPQLFSDLHANDDRIPAAQQAIASMGSVAVEPLWESFQDSPVIERQRHLLVLRLMGPAAASVTDKLLVLASGNDPKVVGPVMEVLLAVAPERPEVTTRLLGMLTNPKLAIVVSGNPEACKMLAGDGSPEALARMLSYSLEGPVNSPSVQQIVSQTLKNAGQDGQQVVLTALKNKTLSANEVLRLSGVAMSLEIEEAAPMLLNHLRRLSQTSKRPRKPMANPPDVDPGDAVKGLRQSLLNSTARLNGDVKQMLSFVDPTALRNSLDASSLAPRFAIGTVTDADVDEVIRFIQITSQQKTPSGRMIGYQACQFLGPRGKKAIDELARQAAAEDAVIYGGVTPYDVLANIGEAAVPALLKLREQGGQQEVSALHSLGRMGSEAQAALDSSDQWLQKPIEGLQKAGKDQLIQQIRALILEEDGHISDSDRYEIRMVSIAELAKLNEMENLAQRDKYLWAYSRKWESIQPPQLTAAEKSALRDLVARKSSLAAAMLTLSGEAVPQLNVLLEPEWKRPNDSQTLRFIFESSLWYEGDDRERVLAFVRSMPLKLEEVDPNSYLFWLGLEALPELAAQTPRVTSILKGLDPEQIGNPLLLTRVSPDSAIIRGLWNKVPFTCGRLKTAWRRRDYSEFLNLIQIPVAYWCLCEVPCSDWSVNPIFEDPERTMGEFHTAEKIATGIQLVDLANSGCEDHADPLPLWKTIMRKSTDGPDRFATCRKLWAIHPTSECATLIADRLGLTHAGLTNRGFDVRTESQRWAIYDDIHRELGPRLDDLKREAKENSIAETRTNLRRLVKLIESDLEQ